MDGEKRIRCAVKTGEIYSVGECPVCPGAGAVLALQAADSTPVFYCPSCGTAWREVPDPTRIDSVDRLARLAPNGVRALTREEVARAGLQIVEVLKASEIDDELRQALDV